MPELPEVETVRRGLAACLSHAKVERILLRRSGLRVPFPPDMAALLTGATLQGITRRAKYLLFHFSGGQALIVHLGMSGRMVAHASPPPDYQPHDHVVVTWSNGITLVFNDARRFGLMTLCEESALAAHPLLHALGPEPLEEGWGAKQLHAALQTSAAPVKVAIMDQRKLVGVGNIYACEALFRAHIHPARIARSITKEQARSLASAIRRVLEEAIASGGSTLRDYVRSSGDAGYFQHHFNVYGRVGKPCPVCGVNVMQMHQAGRSTFFCPHCQAL